MEGSRGSAYLLSRAVRSQYGASGPLPPPIKPGRWASIDAFAPAPLHGIVTTRWVHFTATPSHHSAPSNSHLPILRVHILPWFSCDCDCVILKIFFAVRIRGLLLLKLLKSVGECWRVGVSVCLLLLLFLMRVCFYHIAGNLPLVEFLPFFLVSRTFNLQHVWRWSCRIGRWQWIRNVQSRFRRWWRSSRRLPFHRRSPPLPGNWTRSKLEEKKVTRLD